MEVKVEDLKELYKILMEAPPKINKRLYEFVGKSALHCEAEVKKVTPANTGKLRSSITTSVRCVGSEVTGAGARIQGIVGSPTSYAPSVETGTKPHWPPKKPIIYWVYRKFKLQGSALRDEVRRIRFIISRYGTKGAHMFEKGFENAQPKIKRMWEKTCAQLVKRDL